MLAFVLAWFIGWQSIHLALGLIAPEKFITIQECCSNNHCIANKLEEVEVNWPVIGKHASGWCVVKKDSSLGTYCKLAVSK